MRLLLQLPLLALAGCGPSVGRSTAPPPPSTPDLDYPVGTFTLTERSGRTVTEKDLAGKVWVASFIFTRCSGTCPAVTSTVARLQRELADQPDVRFVTFTVDPQRDDLTALRKYADLRGADADRWLFLTGDETTIHKLMRDRFKLAVGRKDGPDVKEGDEFDHSSRLTVVDRNGIIRATFEGMPNADREGGPAAFEEGLTKLKEMLRALEGER